MTFVSRVIHHDAAEMAAEVRARFSIVTQKDWEISKKYQVFATPFAFVVDEQGKIAGCHALTRSG